MDNKHEAVLRESVQICEWIDRPAEVVYEFALDLANLPSWAAGLGGSVEQRGDQWYVETSSGKVAIAFAPRNPFGVLDHTLTLESGETFYNPMRVVAFDAGSEIVFTLRRQQGMTDEEFARDARAVASDLATLKQLLENGTLRSQVNDHRNI